MKFSSLNYASIGTIMKKIRPTDESIEQFEVTSFWEGQYTLLRFLRISHKGCILQKNSPLHTIFVIKLRVEWWHFE